MSDIYRAAGAGDLCAVKRIVTFDPACVNATGLLPFSPLCAAARGGHVDVVAYLLDHGARVRRRDHSGRTALAEACAGGHAEVVDLLMQRGADAELTQAFKDYAFDPLMEACRNGHAHVLSRLVETDVSLVENDGSLADKTSVPAGRNNSKQGSSSGTHSGNARTRTHTHNQPAHTRVRLAGTERGRRLMEVAVARGYDACVRVLMGAGVVWEMDGKMAASAVRGQSKACRVTVEEWERVYLLYKCRKIVDAVSALTTHAHPHTDAHAHQLRVDAAPEFLRRRTENVWGTPLPDVQLASSSPHTRTPVCHAPSPVPLHVCTHACATAYDVYCHDPCSPPTTATPSTVCDRLSSSRFSSCASSPVYSPATTTTTDHHPSPTSPFVFPSPTSSLSSSPLAPSHMVMASTPMASSSTPMASYQPVITTSVAAVTPSSSSTVCGWGNMDASGPMPSTEACGNRRTCEEDVSRAVFKHTVEDIPAAQFADVVNLMGFNLVAAV